MSSRKIRDLTSIQRDLTSIQRDLTSIQRDLTSIQRDLTSIQKVPWRALKGIGQTLSGGWLNTNGLVVSANCVSVVTSYPTGP